MEALFGKKTEFKDSVRKWKSEMRHEQRTLDRQIRSACTRNESVCACCVHAVLQKP